MFVIAVTVNGEKKYLTMKGTLTRSTKRAWAVDSKFLAELNLSRSTYSDIGAVEEI